VLVAVVLVAVVLVAVVLAAVPLVAIVLVAVVLAAVPLVAVVLVAVVLAVVTCAMQSKAQRGYCMPVNGGGYPQTTSSQQDKRGTLTAGRQCSFTSSKT
jgi:hypothetical protein